MTTTVIKQVKASGGDYVDVPTAWAAIPSNLVTVDQQWILEYTGSFPTNATLTGKTCDATRDIIFRPATGHGYADVPGNAIFPAAANGAYLSATAAGEVLTLAQPFLTIQGLQINSTAGGGNVAILINSPSDLTTVLHDVVASSSNGSSGVNGTIVATVPYTSINTIAINTAGGNGFFDSGNASHHNSAAYGTGGTGYGFRGNYSTPLRLNCKAFGFATAFRSDSGTGSDYCASDDTTAPGTHALHSLTFANEVINTSSDFHTKTGASCLGAGTRDASSTGDLDALKQSRSTTSPAIGPLELYTAAPSLALTGPSSGVVSVASTNFTITGSNLTGSVVCTPTATTVAGAFTPTTVTLTTGSPTGTFTFTPSGAATGTIGITNASSITNPTPVAFTAAASGPPPASPANANVLIENASAGSLVSAQVFTKVNNRAAVELCSYGFSDSGSGRTGTLTVPTGSGDRTLSVPLTSAAIAATTIGQSVLVSVVNGSESTGNATVLYTGVIA